MAILTPRSRFISKLNNYKNFIINNQKSTFIITTSINKSLLFRSLNNNSIYKNDIFKPSISLTFNQGFATKSASSNTDAASATPEKLPVEKDTLVEKMKSYYKENYINSFNKLLKDVKNYKQNKSNIYLNCLFYDNLSNDLTQLLEDPIDYNVTIEIGDAPLTYIYKVHSIILQSRSLYFKKKFNEITFNDDHVKVLKLSNISVKVFDVIIKYIYGGKISLEKLENSTIFDLVIASNELELDELVEYLQIYLVKNCVSWLRLEFARIYKKSQVKNLEIIKDFYNDIIAKYPNTILKSKNLHSLTEDSLISILKQDDLQLEESKIWEYVIEWGKAKNPSLPTNLDKWTSDHFLSLKETLKGCLPHIRYFNISGEDVVKKIYPYQQLLEHQLFLDINTRLIASNLSISSIVLPSRKILNTTLPTRITPIPFSSNIITNEHVLEISSWIDKKETPYVGNHPYEFKLLARGSRDGFHVGTIYNICDRVANTIIILKVEGTGEILGGYNPLEWENNIDRCKENKESFVFSLKTTNLKNSILSRASNNCSSAIYNYPKDLRLGFGRDLWLIGNLKNEKKCCCLESSAYFKRIRSDEFISPTLFVPSEKSLFSVEEYEIFQISPKIIILKLQFFLIIFFQLFA
ncbi:hypothetical protein Glove_236g66 [Diversispora epigaea]|uniref:BTB domain-containing protein n=1 Tax=Diversispora epigaea TaxID=1348612 RepID=A0A397IAJ2_9GLOM|nr:hypothetical protein Glove_236g66 [Diversispora epigaea]